tara:strand:+ start:278 stop:571 length:294 start_codon:yes stop_codon:yes gene_type:complete
MNLTNLMKSNSIETKAKSDFYYVEITPAIGKHPELRDISQSLTANCSQLWISMDADESVADEQLKLAQAQFTVEYQYTHTSKKDNLERAVFILTPLK